MLYARMYSHPTHKLIQDRPGYSIPSSFARPLHVRLAKPNFDVERRSAPMLSPTLQRSQSLKLMGEEIEMSVLTDARWAAGQVHDGRWGTRGNYP